MRVYPLQMSIVYPISSLVPVYEQLRWKTQEYLLQNKESALRGLEDTLTQPCRAVALEMMLRPRVSTESDGVASSGHETGLCKYTSKLTGFILC